MSPAEVQAAYQATLARVHTACARAGRAPESVTLIAVSKTKPVELLQAAYDAGCRDFGENYAQELAAKAPALPRDIRWHFIGHLQRNKAKLVAPVAALVHTLDSEPLAEALCKHRDGAPLRVLLEINLAREPQKSGVAPEDALSLLRALRARPGVEVEGLMAIPPETAHEGEARAHFAALRQLRDTLAAATGAPLPSLSMGMSGDADAAIAEGATHVRIGTAIFGARG